MEYKDPGKYIPIIYLLYSWGSRFGVPSRVPLGFRACNFWNLARKLDVFSQTQTLGFRISRLGSGTYGLDFVCC